MCVRGATPTYESGMVTAAARPHVFWVGEDPATQEIVRGWPVGRALLATLGTPTPRWATRSLPSALGSATTVTRKTSRCPLSGGLSGLAPSSSKSPELAAPLLSESPGWGDRRTGCTPDITFVASFFRKPLVAFSAVLVAGPRPDLRGDDDIRRNNGYPSPATPKLLTPAQFRQAGERIGRSVCLQLKPIVNKKPHSLREVSSGMRRITAVFDRLTRESIGSSRRLPRHLSSSACAATSTSPTGPCAGRPTWPRRISGDVVLFVRSPYFKNIGKRFGPAHKGKLRCGRANVTTA